MSMEEPTVRPGDLGLDELRRIGGSVAEAIAAYHAGLDRRGVLPDVTPAEVAALFTGGLPAEGEPAETLIEDWRQRVAPLLTAVGSPRHFAYVNGSGAMIGIFAEALAACTNTNAGAWPAGSRKDRGPVPAVDRKWVGYPKTRVASCLRGFFMARFTAILAALVTSPRTTPRRTGSGPRSWRPLPPVHGRASPRLGDPRGGHAELGRRAVTRPQPARLHVDLGRWTGC
jgi:hypothetical protein